MRVRLRISKVGVAMFESGRDESLEKAWPFADNGDCWVGVSLLTFILRSPDAVNVGEMFGEMFYDGFVTCSAFCR